MKIILVSRSWPSNDRSGVPLAAAEHAKILISDGHEVSIIGSYESVLFENLSGCDKYFVSSKGTGALHSYVSVDKKRLQDIYNQILPDLIIVEAWQTSLTEAAIDIALKRSLPVLVISHGISVHKFSNSWIDFFHAISWFPYKLRLKNRLRKINAITALDMESKSSRFYDRDLALRVNVPVIELVNTPINFASKIKLKSQRKLQIILIGYFSRVKNQMAAIDLFKELPGNLSLVFVGARTGKYYESCLKKVAKLGLESRVFFYEDHECNINEEISNSILMLSTSLTEVLSISLLEAMASGTPFVATSCGANSSLQAGVVTSNRECQKRSLLKIITDEDYWNTLSKQGILQYQARFKPNNVVKGLRNAVMRATSGRLNE